MKKIIFTILILAFLFLIFPYKSSAALVPCGWPDPNPATKELFEDPEPATPENEACPCSFCHFFLMFGRIIDFITWKIVPLIGLLMLIAGGIMFVVSSGNPEALSRAKKFLLATLIGLFIIYAAWLILHTIFTVVKIEKWTGIAEGGFSVKCMVPGLKPSESPEYDYICEDKNQNCVCDVWEEYVPPPPPPPPPPPGCKIYCDNHQDLANCYDVPYPEQNNIQLTLLIGCLDDKATAELGVDLGHTFTYDETHKICNYTRGEKICEGQQCSHSEHSCHYGGKTGKGALAADFQKEHLFTLVKDYAAACQPEMGTAICVLKEKDHLHISLPLLGDCDMDLYNAGEGTLPNGNPFKCFK